jgi:DNA-binding NarL/FixJ family response regulator/signal transduction histidine kinase
VALLQDSSDQEAKEQEARRDAGRRSIIDSAVSLLNAEVGFQAVLAQIASPLPDLLPFDWLTISTIDESTAQIERIGALSTLGATPAAPSDATPDEQDLVQRALASGTPVLVRDVADERALDGSDDLLQAGVHACLAIPIMVGDHAIGVLSMMSRQPDVFSEEHVSFATSLAQLFGLALQHETSERRARESATREERERLAREIHDTLAQTITSMVMQLDLVVTTTPSDAPQRTRLEQAREMAREALAETRRTVWNMRPQNVNLQVPRTVLQEEVALFERRMQLKPEVVTAGEERQVTPDVGAVLQRLLRVTLENIWAHSEAEHVRILMDYGLQSLTLLIEDDGRGFDPDSVDLQGEGRVGLAGVAERVRSIGGTLRLESAADQGTRVQAELPYTAAPPARAPQPLSSEPAAPVKVAATTDAAIRVLLIDDHAMVREGLERMMQDQPDLRVVAAAANGTDGLRRIAELQPDVVLCDLQLPDMSGIEVISKVRTHYPDIRCLVVTTYDDDESIYEGFKAGAKGYVLKDVSASELASAVRAAARGESLLQPVVARKLVEGFGELARQGGIVEALTEREIEVLRALASGARNKEIAFSLGLSESTIKTHLASIFGKLNVTTRTEAVAKGRELGLISL